MTAGLTAYYMSRQVMLVFGGQARWVEHNDAHGAAGPRPGTTAGTGRLTRRPASPTRRPG